MDYLKILHGTYNILIMLLFFYQGWLGLKIRRERKAGGQRDFSVIRKHRKFGPFLVLLGILGFLAGLVLVVIDTGHLIEYPLHLTVGLVLACLITAIYIIAKKIKGIDSPLRNLHFTMGSILVGLYLVQCFIGLGVLL
jgi:hypothetical protein